MSFEEGVDGGIFRSRIQSKSFLRLNGEAQIVVGVLELARSKVRSRRAGLQAFPITERHRV